MRRNRRFLIALSVFICLLALTGVFSRSILWSLGQLLVNAESPQKADAVVVLGGDYAGNRALKGAELVREGYAPRLVLSMGSRMFGRNESEVAADYAASRGYDRSTMICLTEPVTSTSDEGRTIVPKLRELGVHKILLVTGPGHTARATRVFRRAGPDLEIHPVAAPDPLWCNGYWWKNRECQKTFFFEEVKTLADFLRI